MERIMKKIVLILLAAAMSVQSYGIYVQAEEDPVVTEQKISDADQEMAEWIMETLVGQEDTISEWSEQQWEMLSENQRLAAEIFSMQPSAEGTATYVQVSGYVPTDGDQVAYMSLKNTGYTDGLGNTFWKISNGGENVYCMDHGSSLRGSYAYGNVTRSSGAAQYLIDTYGGNRANSTEWYMSIQMAVWALLSGQSASSVYTYAFSWFIKGGMDSTKAAAWAQTTKNFFGYADGMSGSCYIAEGPAGSQRVGKKEPFVTKVFTDGESEPGGEESEEVDAEFEEIEETVTVDYEINVHKADWQTGVGLFGCYVDIYEDGEKIATVKTDANGNASYESKKTASFNASYCSNYKQLSAQQQAEISGFVSVDEAQAEIESQKKSFENVSYTYSCRESTAPFGYVWQVNERSKRISGNERIEFEITNERTLGAVELIKYDTESESEITQGEASLQGAIYGIYAAENIVHQDQKTGILYKKDELVASAEIGRSPVQNEEGYLMNTDGSRHIVNPQGELLYESTPGRTLFGDLELGRYYIKEIIPAEGYLLDESIYDVTFTYKDQMVKVEAREESALEDDNTLTVDDANTSKTVYSGDYVMKQGIQFVKTSDNTYQTELKPIEGAGFCVYLIEDLSGVKDGSLKPVSDSWGVDDILTFYDYDFTNEPRAVLYKRTLEPWTDGDQKWLSSLGNNKYEVKEMFTDADGRIETPELPYGTYVVVETTTPEDHVAAKPFIVYITQDSRSLQKQRIINNTITKAFLRVVKADEEFLVKPGSYVKAEETVRGTVLKEGAQYRVRCLSLEHSRESLKALNWKYDLLGYLSYYDPNAKELQGNVINPFTTTFLKENDKIIDCYITLPQELPVGTYELIEITAPSGYVLNGAEQMVVDKSTDRINAYEIVDSPQEALKFTIGNGVVYPDGQMGKNKYATQDQYGNLTVTILQENQEQKGIVEIYKHGEQLADVKKKENQNIEFFYEDAPVEGAEFQIIAMEDIYTQELDRSLSEQYAVTKEAYLVCKKGDVAATIKTDRNGWGYASELYIGKYKLIETMAGDGFVLNKEETVFEVTPQQQKVRFDIHSFHYLNERQKLKIQVNKVDSKTGKSLSGAVFGLYNAEPVSTGIAYDEQTGKWVIRDEEEFLLEKDTLVAQCTTDEAGMAVFETDLPLGKYYVKEIQAPTGYLKNDGEFPVDGSYTGVFGGQMEEIQVHQLELKNDPINNIPEEKTPDETPENHEGHSEKEEKAQEVLKAPIEVITAEPVKTGDGAPLLFWGILLIVSLVIIVKKRRAC